jgi:hypothetical protein
MDSTTESDTNLLTWVWNKQSVWSQAASKLKQSLSRARTASLWLTILAAILATAATQIAPISDLAARALAAGGALSMALVVLLQKATSRERVQDWTRARSVSEALKAETFTFLAGVAPYRGADRTDQLRLNVDQVLEKVDDLTSCTTDLMPAARELPAVTDVTTYISTRVRQQIDTYYRPQSAAMKHRADRYRFAETALAVLALLLSFATTVTGWQGFAAWSPVIAAVVAAVAAHTAASRFDALALEYARTYEQLDRLLVGRGSARVDADQSQKADDDFVSAAEAVISSQNQAWMSRTIAAAGPEKQGDGSSPNPHAG